MTRKSKKSLLSSFSSGNNADNTTSKLQSQVTNYKTRLRAAGSDYDASDDRNFIEKALNLEKGQNALFDVLEIINRPQNALLTGVNNALSGGSFGEGLKEGITGETKTTGKDILVDQFDMDDEQGKLDLSDVLGFGVDLVTDPMDWALIPATGGASKAAELGADAARIASKVDNAADAAKGLKFISGNELVGKAIGKGIKTTGKLADKAIEGTLGVLDNRTTNQISKALGKSIDLATPDEILQATREVGKSADKLQTYRDIKKGFRNLVDSSSAVGGFVGRSRGYDASSDLDNLVGRMAKEDIVKDAEKLAKQTGVSKDDILRKALNAVESNADWTLRGQDVIKKFKEEKVVDFLTPEQASKIQTTLDKFGIKTSVADDVGRKLRLDSNISDLYKIQDALFDSNTGEYLGEALGKEGTSFRDLTFGSKNYKEVDDLLRNDREFFNSKPELKNFYNKFNNAVRDYATNTSDIERGLNAGEAVTEGYAKHSRTDVARRSADKEFTGREAKYDASTAQINRMAEENRVSDIAENKNALDRDLKKVYKTELDDEGNEILLKDKNGDYILDPDKKQNYKQYKEAEIQRKKGIRESAQTVVDYINGKTIDETKLNKKGKDAIERINKITNAQGDLDTLQNELHNLVDSINSYKDLPYEVDGVINEAINSVSEYAKKVTNFKDSTIKALNKSEKGVLDTVGGLLDQGENLKGAYINQVKTSRAKAFSDMAKVKGIVETNNKGYIKDIAKVNKNTSELVSKIQKTENKLKNLTKQKKLIEKQMGELVERMDKQINLGVEELKNISDTSENLFNKTLKNIEDRQAKIALLESQEGQLFFKDKFDETFADYVRGAAQQNAGTKKFNDALATGLFDNEDYIKVAKEGEKVGYGYTKIKGNKLIDKFNDYKPIMTDDFKNMEGVLEKFKDKDVIIDKQFMTALNVASNFDSSKLNPLFKVWDGMNNVFKKFTTLNPGFHMRNIVGNSTNMVLSGVNPAALPDIYKEAHTIWNNADDLIAKATKGALNEAETKQFNILKQFYEGGFADALKKGYGLDEIAERASKNTKNPINKISRWSIEKNNQVDAYNRLALLIYANKTPKYLEKLGKKNAIDAVRYVLFDPNNLSEGEKAFKKVMPFYTFTKQNLLFQGTNFLKNTGRYSKLYKSIRDSYDDLDENSYKDYQRDSMQIPLPFTGSDGNQLFLKANLPVSDLGEFLSNPVQRTVASVSPIIKTPIEMTTGKNLFTGNESNYTTLSSSRAAKKLNDTLTNMGISTTGITKVEDAADLILNNFGLQNVSTNVVKKVEAILENADGNTSGQQLWAEIFRSILQNTKEESVRNSGLYDELEKYQAEIKRLKNQGIDVPTIKEITASNKIKVNKLKNKRARSN